MKRYFFYTLNLCAPLWLAAQEIKPQPRQRNVPREASPQVPVPPEKRNPAWRRVKKAPPGVPLPEDVVLHINGSFQGHFPLDIELPAGRGPHFEIQQEMTGMGPQEKRPPILYIKATVTEVDGGYRVDYDISARVELVPPKGQAERVLKISSNIEIRDVMIQGAVLVKPGEAVVIGKFKGKELSLTVSKSFTKPIK